MSLGLFLVMGVATNVKKPAVDARMESLHATLEDFRRTGELRHLDRGDASRLKGLGRAACGKDFNAP